MRSNYRGINVYLEGTSALKVMPDLLAEANPKDFSLDRWLPLDIEDKISSTFLPEIHEEWIETESDQVIFGMERWGEMIPDNYTEYFAVIVVRPSLMRMTVALRYASGRNFSGSTSFIVP